jgi:hypothetical protein
MSVQSKPKRSKKRGNNNLKPNVVIRLFLYETLAIRNLTKRIQELDQKLAREFVSFNRASESIEKRNRQIGDLCVPFGGHRAQAIRARAGAPATRPSITCSWP